MTRQKKTTLCPLGGVGVGGKWKFWIWYHLLGGPRRFGELRRLLPQASRQMLTIQLRELEHLGGRWKFWIWYHLFGGPKRFSELQQLLPQANRQTLSVQLRELEQMGVLHRKAYEQMPPKVEYALTEWGQRSESMLRQMYAWGRWCCEQIGVAYEWPVSDEAENPTNRTKGKL